MGGFFFGMTMTKIVAPTLAEVKDRLEYSPETGVFRWRRGGPHVSAGMVAGAKSSKGYIRVKFNSFPYPAHRLAWLYVYGEWPAAQIDHIDGDKSNNRISNLRLATPAQNSWNQAKRKNNTSGYKGVRWNSSNPRKSWLAAIGHQNRKISLGRYSTKEEAHHAYCVAAQKFHGEFANVGAN